MNRRDLFRGLIAAPLLPLAVLTRRGPEPELAGGIGAPGYEYTVQCRHSFEEVPCDYSMHLIDCDTIKNVDLNKFVREEPPTFTITYVKD